MGFPIIVTPWGHHNPIWALTAKFFVPYLNKLPDTGFTRYNTQGWNFHDKHLMHEQLGNIVVHVNPSQISIFIADPATSDRVLFKRKEFLHPLEMTEMTKLFGPHLGATKGAKWQRQRKITSQTFNEANNGLVWEDSVRQAEEMGEYWKELDTANSVEDDTVTLALHVLTRAGLGISYELKSALDQAKDGFSMNYRDCLANLLSSTLYMALLPKFLYKYNSHLPQGMKDYTMAVNQFRHYMLDMVKEERQRISSGLKPKTPNLLSTLVIKSDEANPRLGTINEEKSGEFKAGIDSGLSEDELYGNLFIFNLGGHETTAHTLCYAVYLLVAYPDWQEWAREDVDHVYGKGEEEVRYADAFPNLKICLALMYETLRIYTPLLDIPKITTTQTQVAEFDGRMVTIPPKTAIHPNISALHSFPVYWGSDSLIWRPNRWIELVKSKDTSISSFFSEEKMVTAKKGTYIPWSDGPRGCSGKRFSKVEFVGTISTLLRKYKIEVVPKYEETVEAARQSVLDVTLDSNTNFTLQMNDPNSVAIKLVQR